MEKRAVTERFCVSLLDVANLPGYGAQAPSERMMMETLELIFGLLDDRDAWVKAGVLAAMLLAGLAWMAQRRWLRLRRERDAQAAFARRSLAREESEREQLAKEIQDGFVHRLVLLRNAALTALAQPGSPKAVTEELDHISGLALSALDEARALAQRLRPVELDRLGWTRAVEELLARHLAASGVRVFKDLPELDGTVSHGEALCLYRLVEAMVRELSQRAGLTTVLLDAKLERDYVRLRLEHDGSRPEPGGGAAPGTDGEGLSGVVQRVWLVGGEFRSSVTEIGTCWQIAMPRGPAGAGQ